MLGEIVECENCGKPFEMKRKVHRFCGSECRYQHWIRVHPRIIIGQGFKIVPDEPGGRTVRVRGIQDEAGISRKGFTCEGI
jgi:hypothetical protein